MWGFGSRYYWCKKERRGGKIEGIIVVFTWMSSQERHLRKYVELYSSLGWNSLVCHSEFLNMFFPEKAATIASAVLNELLEELKVRPCPVVFASFSGGTKACMYKVLQIIDRKHEAQLNKDECQLIRDCIVGHIYDSSPVDFTSDLGTRFAVHPSILKISRPPRLATWIANGIASGLDALFLSRFESQRAEYWQTLYSSVSIGGPYLIFRSENDDLAPYQIIDNFAQRLKELGGDVKLVKWSVSPHVGHFLQYPIDYRAAVTELLGKASALYSQKIRRLEGEKAELEGIHDDVSEPIHELRKAAVSPRQSFRGTSDNFLLPSSMEYYEGGDVGSMQDESKEGVIHLPNPPTMNPHGVLGQILFDVCVPRNVEGWDMRSSGSMNGRPYASRQRHAPFNPIKCIRRSRL